MSVDSVRGEGCSREVLELEANAGGGQVLALLLAVLELFFGRMGFGGRMLGHWGRRRRRRVLVLVSTYSL